jgi:hypothetical protein
VTGGGKAYRYHVDREDLAQVSPEGQVGQERTKVRTISSLQSITKMPQYVGPIQVLFLELCHDSNVDSSTVTVDINEHAVIRQLEGGKSL